jgi:nucleoside-diphosphate-sugar epimerase
MELIADARVARETLGWQSRVTLEDGVARTAASIRDYLAEYKPELYVI